MESFNYKFIVFVLISFAIIILFNNWNFDFARAESARSDSAVLVAKNPTGGSGSAVYVGNGYVLTAHHILDRSRTLTLTTDSGADIESEYLWSAEGYDIALFRVDPNTNLNSYNLDCAPLQLHDQLMFIGNPLNLTHILVNGTVAGDSLYNMADHWTHLTPVQAPIIPGMSGGPAVDAYGNLRGINVGTMILNQGFAFSFTGISYIVPSEAVCMLMGR